MDTSLTYLQNRQATEDIDYILDPHIENQAKIEEKLHVAISSVAKDKNYSPEWINNKVGLFVVGATRISLFQDSVSQNVILWSSQNLVVYAAKWDWSLARKLKRIGSTRREIDISDAVAILHVINTGSDAPLSRQTAKGWNEIVYTPIEDDALDEVARRYKEQYGLDGLV